MSSLPLPEVQMPEWDDMDFKRNAIYDSVLNSFSKKFPHSYGGVRVEVDNLHYTDPESATLAEQKKALMRDQYLHRRLRGAIKLVDEKTGEILDQRDEMTLMRVPVLTQRGTFIHNGSEYTLINQARLEPGIYTRRKATGELESHFNAKRGSGPSFRIHLEPDTGLFKLNIGQSSLRLYSLLHDIGIPDSQLEEAWGKELLDRNKQAYDARVLNKAHARLVRRADANLPLEVKIQQIKDALAKTKVSRGVVGRTLPNLFNRKVASAWSQGISPQTPDVNAWMPETPSAAFVMEDYVRLALFLNKEYNAGILDPENRTKEDLVAELSAKLQELMPVIMLDWSA